VIGLNRLTCDWFGVLSVIGQKTGLCDRLEWTHSFVGSLKRAAMLFVWVFSGALKRAAVWPKMLGVLFVIGQNRLASVIGWNELICSRR